MTDDPGFEILRPDEDVAKRPGYCWVEVDHHVIDAEQGIAAISRCGASSLARTAR